MHAEVAIVGGGPVGLGLAIELGQRDISTVVVEREDSLHRIPKGQNLTQRTMEHLRSWGVEDRVRAERLMPPDYPAAGVNAYGDLMSEYAHPWFKRSTVDPYYFTSNERLPQYLTERALRERVDELESVEVRYGVAGNSVRQSDSAAVVEADGLTIEAEYVVGCDGSHSTVRAHSSIGESRSDHDRKMALLVFRSRELHDILESRHGKAAFFNVLHPDLDGYWRFLGRVDVGEGWFFHAPVPPDSTVENLDYEGLLADTVGVGFSMDLDYVGFWNLRIAIADTYQDDRILIAGDAAHSHPPYGGYGINTGFEDARNLGWKLGAVLAGWGGSELVESYTLERRPVFASTARDFIEAFIERDRTFIQQHDPRVDEADFRDAWEQRKSGTSGVRDFEPHYEGSPIVAGARGGTPGAVGQHSFEPRAGHHLSPPGAGESDGLFETLGRGFSLIADSDDKLTIESFRRASEERGVPLTVLTGSSAPGVAGYRRLPILVRPDHFISWVGDGSGHCASEILNLSIGQPA